MATSMRKMQRENRRALRKTQREERRSIRKDSRAFKKEEREERRAVRKSSRDKRRDRVKLARYITLVVTRVEVNVHDRSKAGSNHSLMRMFLIKKQGRYRSR